MAEDTNEEKKKENTGSEKETTKDQAQPQKPSDDAAPKEASQDQESDQQQDQPIGDPTKNSTQSQQQITPPPPPEDNSNQPQSKYRLTQKRTNVSADDLAPSRQTGFDILDPSERQKFIEKERRRSDFDQPEDISVIERRLQTKELDVYARDTENRRIEEKQAALTAESLNLPFINLYGFPLSMKALDRLDENTAKEAELMPFYFDEIEIRLGTPNPKNGKQKEVLDKLRGEGLLVTLYYISESSYKSGFKYYKDVIKDIQRTESEKVEVSEELMGELSDHIEELKNIKDHLEKMSVTKILDVFFGSAVKLKASDVHFEPAEKEIRLRFRIDGVLQDVMEVPQDVYKQLLSRIKLISQLKVNVTTTPQDGRFTITLPEKKLDVRVSILPSGYGESVVARLLGVGALALEIDKLGLTGYSKEVIMRQLEKPYGMILTTGPTGSGKTTTLYSFLNHLNEPGTKIITLEDPIEYRLKGIQQTQIEKEEGLDFAAGLRSVLRHDPDIVLVGEIRDLETAEIAINAAQTGHFVLSTLHTNDAAGVLPRMINMGLRQFVIAPAVNAIIAQRLVRVLCENCKEEYTPDQETVEFIKNILGDQLMEKHVPKELKLFRAKQCKDCATGYKGRLGIFEVFEVGDEMEKLIMRSATVAEIREQAIAAGMILLRQDGILKAINGITTIEEVKRVSAT